MPASPHIRPSEGKDAAAVLVHVCTTATGSPARPTIRKGFVHMQTTCWCVSEIHGIPFRSSGITRSPSQKLEVPYLYGVVFSAQRATEF
jgi:hypothetical protein